MCLDDVKGRQSFPFLVEHSHVTKIVLHDILENASICHLPRNTEASRYRATSVTSSGDLLLVKHNVDWKRVDMGREHLLSKSCMETQIQCCTLSLLGKLA